MSSVEEVPQPVAEEIIRKLGGQGLPPSPNAVPYYSVGIDEELETFEQEYLGEEGAIGGPPIPGFYSARTYPFLVSARNGEGKTHFVYALLKRAYELGYVGVYVELDATNRPLDDEFLIYKAVVSNVWLPENGAVNYRKSGLDKLLQKWVEDQWEMLDDRGVDPSEELLSMIEGLEFDTPRVEFRRAVKAYLREVVNENPDRAERIYGWLAGQMDPPQWDGASFSKLDAKSGDQYIASVTTVIRALGYQGTILVFDEAEAAVVPSEEKLERSSTRKKALAALFNFLNLIRQPQNIGIEHSLVLYCTTDAIEGITLHPALATAFLDPKSVFSAQNPTGSFIDLGAKLTGPESESMFQELGRKLASIYWTARRAPDDVDKERLDQVADLAARAIVERTDVSGNLRRFVRGVIQVFNETRAKGTLSKRDVEDIIQGASAAPYEDPGEGTLG